MDSVRQNEQNHIPRKPVAQSAPTTPSGSYDIVDAILDDYLKASTHDSTSLPQKTQVRIRDVDRDLVALPPRQASAPLWIPNAPEPSLVPTPSPSAPVTPTPSRSRWKAVVDETVYFAGGLISRPFESTRHHTILRHSPGLVFYKGSSTNIVITVFADADLPADRSFWLQRKGFSGGVGMAASALMRTTSNWIDITPSAEALSSALPEGDERGWQRDIRKLQKRIVSDKRLVQHTPRETCVLRIPASCSDGYLRIVMCTGETSKKPLCPSPIFRLASTSSDVSVLRGASLTTMPVEAGLKIASVVGNAYAQRVVGPAQAVVGNGVKRMQPAFVAKRAAVLSFAKTQVKGQFASLEDNFDATRDVIYDLFHQENVVGKLPEIIGSDTGPDEPFPIPFEGKVVPGASRQSVRNKIPTAALSHVSDDLLLRLKGVYIGWASVRLKKNLNNVSEDWHEAIITIGPVSNSSPGVVLRNVVNVHMIHDFGAETTFFDAKLKVILMAFLRPIPEVVISGVSPEPSPNITQDKRIAVASLSRQQWLHSTAIQVSSQRNKKRTTERYIDFRSDVQRRVDSIPIHWVGVRSDRAELKDLAHGRGGFFVRR
ncbi:hypothetical protein F5Y18DRAFT_335279 [Xylariaceae sp. FL1019]|nr:hypothetical protein F5Y18DRAFT_335279 [Xylariaceae sp. FL1019]